MDSPEPPCGMGVYHKVAAPYFFIIMYMVQLHKEDWTFLHMLGCRAVALPSTERIADVLSMVTYFRYRLTINGTSSDNTTICPIFHYRERQSS